MEMEFRSLQHLHLLLEENRLPALLLLVMGRFASLTWSLKNSARRGVASCHDLGAGASGGRGY